MSEQPGSVPAVPGVVAVVGATATGKSDLGVELALRLGGEVLNADSMQLYRGMDIGTAKVTPEQQRGVPHHLLDVWSVREPASVATYQRLARDTIAEVTARGAVAVLVGGSGLYLRAALDHLDFPGTDAAVRERLEHEHAELGGVAMHARLAAVDPQAAAAIPAANSRRVVRALEVVEITGGPYAASMPDHRYLVPAVQIGLELPRAALITRITQRVDRMWERGLVDEVRRLEGEGLREGPTASRALGYAQVLRHLAGECTEDEAREETVRATRRFARRQDSWFRPDPRVRWVPAGPAALVADRIVGQLTGVAEMPDSR